MYPFPLMCPVVTSLEKKFKLLFSGADEIIQELKKIISFKRLSETLTYVQDAYTSACKVQLSPDFYC